MFARRTNSRQRRNCGSGNSVGATGAPFLPTSITSATKRFWHDAQDNATIVPGTGVAGWIDKFGNGYDVSQATGAKQPTVVTDAFGGRQSLRFTAASIQGLTMLDAGRATAFAGGDDVANEWWAVFRSNNTSGTQSVLTISSSASSSHYSLDTVVAGAWQHIRQAGGAQSSHAQSGAVPVAGTHYVMRCAYTGTNAQWTVNGVPLTTAGSSDTAALTINQIEYGYWQQTSLPMDGWIGESVGVTGSVSADEATRLTTYFKEKWGISF